MFNIGNGAGRSYRKCKTEFDQIIVCGFANTDIVGQIPVVVFYLKIAATGYSKSSQFKWKRLTPSLNNEYNTFFSLLSTNPKKKNLR